MLGRGPGRKGHPGNVKVKEGHPILWQRPCPIDRQNNISRNRSLEKDRGNFKPVGKQRKRELQRKKRLETGTLKTPSRGSTM